MTDLETIRNAGRTQVMGVLNITEDSFSDGGLWLQPDKAVEHGRAMMAGHHRHRCRIDQTWRQTRIDGR